MNFIRQFISTRTIRALIYFFIFYVGFGVYLYVIQERLIYHPPSFTFDSCLELPDASLVVENGTRLFVGGSRERVLVIYHGNAGTVCDRAWYAHQAEAMGWGYILVSYSGFGDGSGAPTHERIREDVHNVIAYLERIEPQEVRLLGESLGSAVAAYHASLLAPDALLLITPFDTLRNVARHHYWYYPTSLLVREAYDSVANLRTFTGEIIIIHGTRDRIVPYERGRSLYQSLSTSQKTFISVENADHNDLWQFIELHDVLGEFLK